MSIQMIGTDYHLADVDTRALFSFTKKSAALALNALMGKAGICGGVILSTCNRLELWLSTDDAYEGSLLEELCGLKEVSPQKYAPHFVERREDEAITHLFHLACGLKSQILAEDQILTQVKDALSLARESYSTDNVLEVLFRKAVTAAKRVKTEVVFTRANANAVDRAVELLRQQGFTLPGKTCMVIGNGEMGKLAAQTLMAEGADVTVTVRQYKSGVVNIPIGCKRINYGERMELFPKCDLVVSATSSPNYTIGRELIPMGIQHPMRLIDLAVPRDIEPEVGQIPCFTLYDIDDFKSADEDANKEAMARAEAILNEEMADFHAWYDCRDQIPRIHKIEEEAAEDLTLRLRKELRRLLSSDEDQRLVLDCIDTAARKTAAKLLYGLRDHLEPVAFRDCLDGLEKLYEG